MVSDDRLYMTTAMTPAYYKMTNSATTSNMNTVAESGWPYYPTDEPHYSHAPIDPSGAQWDPAVLRTMYPSEDGMWHTSYTYPTQPENSHYWSAPPHYQTESGTMYVSPCSSGAAATTATMLVNIDDSPTTTTTILRNSATITPPLPPPPPGLAPTSYPSGNSGSSFQWMQRASYHSQQNPDDSFLEGAMVTRSNSSSNRSPIKEKKPYHGVIGKTRTKDKYRVVYSEHQRLELEKEFHFSKYITIKRKTELATQLGLSERQVKIWFQNRRAKERKQKKKKHDVDTDHMSDDQQPMMHPNDLEAHAMKIPPVHAGVEYSIIGDSLPPGETMVANFAISGSPISTSNGTTTLEHIQHSQTVKIEQCCMFEEQRQ